MTSEPTARAALRAAVVLPFYPPDAPTDPASQVQRFPALFRLVQALNRQGIDASGFQLHPHHGTHGPVGFIRPPPGVAALGRLIHRGLPRYGPAYYAFAPGLWQRVVAGQPDVVHVMGVTLDLHLAGARWAARRLAVPLVLGFHGGFPASDPVTVHIRRSHLRSAAAVAFTHPEQAGPWVAAGMLRPDQLATAVETSTELEPVQRDLARRRTGLTGRPLIVWAGRTLPLKDPVTALTAFGLAADRLPGAQLAVLHTSRDLLAPLRGLVSAWPNLEGRVTFMPPVPHSDMASVLSAADYLIATSRREWAGLVVIESMACGTPPILTSIPAFRGLTGEGSVGALFPVGDPRAGAEAIVRLEAEVGSSETARRARRAAVQGWFDAHLSFDAQARQWTAIYRRVTAATTDREAGRGS